MSTVGGLVVDGLFFTGHLAGMHSLPVSRGAPGEAEVSFQWKNPDFLLRNPDFRLKKVDFTIKQALFEQSHAVSAAVCILWSDKQRMHVFISLSGSVEKASLDMLADEISEHSAEVRIIAII